MPRPVYRQRWAWFRGMDTPPEEIIPDVESASFALSSLADRGLLTTRQLADFQNRTGLADFAWRAFWSRSEVDESNGDFRSLLRRTQGFVVFLHGWNGTGAVWELLPALVCAANPRLVALTPDLNGFGRSPFLAEVPVVEQCDPRAVMHTVIDWVEMLGLRSGPRARRRRKVITFVGHSMGGAALFFLQEQGWDENEYARCAVAPALLIDDDLRQGLYQALGVELRANKPIDELKSRLTHHVVDRLLGAVSETTRSEYLRVFEATPKGTLAQTFYAMGAPVGQLPHDDWRNVSVILAHDDRLLNISQMLRALDDLGLAPDQIRVVAGDHFLFSSSDQTRRVHLRNREIILGQTLYLHEACREGQRVLLVR